MEKPHDLPDLVKEFGLGVGDQQLSIERGTTSWKYQNSFPEFIVFVNFVLDIWLIKYSVFHLLKEVLRWLDGMASAKPIGP